MKEPLTKQRANRLFAQTAAPNEVRRFHTSFAGLQDREDMCIQVMTHDVCKTLINGERVSRYRAVLAKGKDECSKAGGICATLTSMVALWRHKSTDESRAEICKGTLRSLADLPIPTVLKDLLEGSSKSGLPTFAVA